MFLFTELSSQFNEQKLIRLRKTLPPGINYVTGRFRRYITPATGPVEVLETREDGKIVAIIDEFNFVREMRLGNLVVYVDLLNHNLTQGLYHSDIVRYGIDFNERLPPRSRPNRQRYIN